MTVQERTLTAHRSIVTQRSGHRPVFGSVRTATSAAVGMLLGALALPAAAQFYSVGGATNTSPVNLIPTLNVAAALADFGSNALNVGAGAAGSFAAQSGATMFAE